MIEFMKSNYLIFIFFGTNFYNIFVNSIEPTCRPKRFAETCRSDEDCVGPNDQCIYGRCSCATNFDKFTQTDKISTCRPAASKVNDTCETACKEPLVCNQGKCFCWKGKNVNGNCVVNCPSGTVLINQMCHTVTNTIGGLCSSDVDCAMANSYCNRGRCQCVAGSVQQGSFCSLSCPDGKPPTQTCRKILVNEPLAIAHSEKMDSCPKGYSCATYGKPNIGHCCKLYCPYGTPDLSKSCNNGGNDCGQTGTHYCQDFFEHGVKNSLCCPRPCREPTPLLINNRCYSKSHRDYACEFDAQCEGGDTMRCSNGVCTCKVGFRKDDSGGFPTCKKLCLLATYVEGQCYRRVRVGEPCLDTSMCPARSFCREGVCICDCASALSANRCINPDDPMNTTPLLDTITAILGAKSRR